MHHLLIKIDMPKINSSKRLKLLKIEFSKNVKPRERTHHCHWNDFEEIKFYTIFKSYYKKQQQTDTLNTLFNYANELWLCVSFIQSWHIIISYIT